MDFPTFLKKARPNFVPPLILVALDPGETTGYALFIKGALYASRQLDTSTLPKFQEIFRHFHHHATFDANHGQCPDRHNLYRPFKRGWSKPDIVVYEDYKVYSWKAEHHSWQSLHTPRIIGALQYLCIHGQIPMYTQMAQMAKGFCTDDKLKEWGYYINHGRHARDAIRHGCYYLLHNCKPDPQFGHQGALDPKHFLFPC